METKKDWIIWVLILVGCVTFLVFDARHRIAENNRFVAQCEKQGGKVINNLCFADPVIIEVQGFED